MTLFTRWTESLEQLRSQGRFREFRLPAGIDLTSNDYLGYGHGRLGLLTNGTLPQSGMASRLLRGHHAIWEEVESLLAAWHGCETVQMMTSGYTANEGLISTLIEPGDWVATDELNHACIVDGLRLAKCRRYSYRHNDLQHLEDGLKAEVARGDESRVRFIITESLFSMDGDLSPLPEIAELAVRYGAHLIVDEAHSTGCFNQNGSGYVDACGVRDRVLCSMHTGGKALGLPGAYIAGSKLLKDYLINRCRHLIFTTAMPPAVGDWWRQRIPQVIADEAGRQQLHANNRLFREELGRCRIHPLGDQYVVPVVIGDDGPAVAASRLLQVAGYDIRAIRPPSVAPGTSRLRISIHADHEPSMLIQLVRAVAESTLHA